MKSLDFASSGRKNIRDNTTGWLNGTLPLPDTYKIGKICKNGHGVNGKSVRYAMNDGCIICNDQRNKKSKNKISDKKQRSNDLHKRAMALYEKQNEETDVFDF